MVYGCVSHNPSTVASLINHQARLFVKQCLLCIAAATGIRKWDCTDYYIILRMSEPQFNNNVSLINRIMIIYMACGCYMVTY